MKWLDKVKEQVAVDALDGSYILPDKDELYCEVDANDLQIAEALREKDPAKAYDVMKRAANCAAEMASYFQEWEHQLDHAADEIKETIVKDPFKDATELLRQLENAFAFHAYDTRKPQEGYAEAYRRFHADLAAFAKTVFRYGVINDLEND